MQLIENQRLRLIDAFRLFCIFYIGVFHTWMVFYNETTSYGSGISIFEWIEGVPPSLTHHCGLFIVSISFFLFGFQEKKLPFWRWPAFLVGVALTQYNGDDASDWTHIASWKWGVFSFLMVAYLLAWVSQKMPRKIQLGFLFAWGLLLLIPITTLAQISHADITTLARQALIGDWVDEDMWSGWFLIPWIFYPLFFMALGILARSYSNILQRLYWKWDLGLLLVTIASWFYFVSLQRPMPLDTAFDASVFQKDFGSILPIVLLPVLIFRWSMLSFVRSLMDSRWVTWISKLAWNRHFWICYLLHLTWLFALASLPQAETLAQPPYIEYVLLGAYLFPEIYAHLHFRRWTAMKKLLAQRRERKKAAEA